MTCPRLDWVSSSISHSCCLDSPIPLLVLRSSSSHLLVINLLLVRLHLFSLVLICCHLAHSYCHLFDLLPSKLYTFFFSLFDSTYPLLLSFIRLLIYCHLFSYILNSIYSIYCHLLPFIYSFRSIYPHLLLSFQSISDPFPCTLLLFRFICSICFIQPIAIYLICLLQTICSICFISPCLFTRRGWRVAPGRQPRKVCCLHTNSITATSPTPR